ncbi:MAG TPA: type II toxin-antitoxin system VapC family toxin [Candidatus Eisenbacteria bacterium]|nr:type II toxin-antitoxin system VapC family toxin [Candidatus Eisenbacteria bacterium]
MSFLLDTDVLSEWVKPRPDAGVVAWLAAVDEDQVFLSVISFAELRRGVELLPGGDRRERLANWIADDLTTRFHGRVLEVDRRVADAWGEMMSRSQRAGRALGAMDGFFAATARSHDLTLVTRNTRDFERLGLDLHDPWAAG